MSLPGAFTLTGKDCVVHSLALIDPQHMLLSKQETVLLPSLDGGPAQPAGVLGAPQTAAPNLLLTPAVPLTSPTPGLGAISVAVWLPLAPTPVSPGDGDVGGNSLSPSGTGMLEGAWLPCSMCGCWGCPSILHNLYGYWRVFACPPGSL